ncbi:5-formyltetrahydrofolate cyclo-ligase [Nesterenkonia alba]|uniref:5-formyltetrahydrofolate cyclo-ligase n=1 Tax=Nesterenkonia alba TaxID=515814 RepID=UPI0003FA004A|nr:5-formyltetrahydrofolate cyclo-ligase [Nesterenkonia alba]
MDLGDPSEATARKAQLRRAVQQRRRRLTGEEITTRAQRLAEVLSGHISDRTTVAGYLPLPGEPDPRVFLEYHLRRNGGQPHPHGNSSDSDNSDGDGNSNGNSPSGAAGVYVPVIPEPPLRVLRWAAWTPQVSLRRSRWLPVQEPLGPTWALDDLLGSAFSSGDSPTESVPPQEIPGEEVRTGDRSRAHAAAALVVLCPALGADASGRRVGQGGGYYDATLGSLLTALPARWRAAVELIAVVHSEDLLPLGEIPAEAHDIRVDAVATERGIISTRNH